MSKTRFSQFGFTLIELMVTLAVAAIIIGLAAPSFSDMVEGNRVITKSNELLSAMRLARSEAIKRKVQVTVRRNGSTNKEWEGGWQVFTDWDEDGVFDDNGTDPVCDEEEDCLLREFDAASTGMTIRANAYDVYVAYAADGTASGDGGLATNTFTLCGANGDLEYARQVVTNSIGRTRVESGGVTSCP